MKSVMTHQFSRIPATDIPRSSFDRSHGLKTTFDAGYLIPIYVDEVLPADTFNCKLNAFGRLATPINPIMDNLFLDTFFFFVPYRLIWSNFKKFMGEQANPDDSTDYVLPNATYDVTENSLLDYMGLPLVNGLDGVCDLPMRAYNLIYNEWFRDQNLQDSIPVPTGDTAGDIANYILRRRGKRHDYFTSCLPWPQKGGEVGIPIAGYAPVVGIGWPNATTPQTSLYVNDTSGDSVQYLYPRLGDQVYFNGGATANGDPLIFADMESATTTINDLRLAFQLQRLLEKDARGGTRYVEIINSHFGVSNAGGDARLQRPEYLGGGSSNINITPIAQTSESATTPQGNLSAMGTVSVNGHGFTKSFTEHGLVIGLANVRADLTYQQGVNRMWSRRTRYDIYWPSLAHIGEQAVLRKEIYADGILANDEIVFGYQERYAEYRYKPSLITGRFRSDCSVPLDSWHLAQDFGSAPALNAAFIEDNPPIDRVIAVPSEPHVILDCYFNLRCARPMPLYGVPGLIDHF